MKPIITNPHGAQEITILEKQSGPITNCLYRIKDKSKKRPISIVLTGEEMSDMCEQWMEYVKRCEAASFKRFMAKYY